MAQGQVVLQSVIYKAKAYPKKKALIVYADTVSEVQAINPKAVKIKDLPEGFAVALPHTVDAVRELEARGVRDVPHVMNTYYPFPGKYKPFHAQRVTADFASMHERCFILNSMGLGKTMTSLWAFDFMRQQGLVHNVLVICPLSVMERTWADEVYNSFPQYEVKVLYGTAAKRKELLAEKADIYVINTDGAGIIASELHKRDDIDLVIIDEVALFRNHGTSRWKVLNTICNQQCKRRVWGLTGSPTPNAPTDAWAQVKLVNPKHPMLPPYFRRFQDMTMYKVSLYKWEAKPTAVAIVHDVMQPSVRFSIDEQLDLPEQVVTQRTIPLTPEQEAAYKTMMTQLVFEYQHEQVSAQNDAAKAQKLLQICCGTAYGENEALVDLPINNRLELLKETIDESEGKVLVFVPFVAALNRVATYLRDHGIETAIVDGSTSKGERDETFAKFQGTESIRVIVANPNTMSHGLTLTKASTIVWFGPTYKNETYQQACARIHRPGQKLTTVIVQIVSSPLEALIYKRLAGKQRLQGTLLDLVAAESQKL